MTLSDAARLGGSSSAGRWAALHPDTLPTRYRRERWYYTFGPLSYIALVLPVPTYTRFLILCCLCLALAACTSYDSAADNQTDKTTARSLIDAIDRYHGDHGMFPVQFDSLVPTYLAAVPKTTRNRDFAYHAFHDSDRGDDYELCFFDGPKRTSRDYGCCYMHFFDNPPHDDGWDCTGGHP